MSIKFILLFYYYFCFTVVHHLYKCSTRGKKYLYYSFANNTLIYKSCIIRNIVKSILKIDGPGHGTSDMF